MKKLVFILLLVLPLIIGGCACTGAYPKELIADVLSEGDDTFVAYRLERGVGDHDVHLQKIDSDGDVLWDEALYSGDNSRVGGVSMVTGDDGVLVAWDVLLPRDGSKGPHDFDHATLASVDDSGDVRWQQDFFEEGIQMVANGEGGVVMAWPDRGSCYARGVDSGGDVLWDETVGSGYGLTMAAGGEGEAFILWNDYDNHCFMVQKVGADGQILWGKEGVTIPYGAETVLPPEPQVVSNGMGGAIVAWVEELGDQPPSCVWVQFISDEGQDLGKTAIGGAGVMVPQMRLVADEPLGFFVVWESVGDGIGICVKRSNPISSYLWPPDGVSVCSGLNQSPRFVATSDGEWGVVVAWIDGGRNLYAQRLDGLGQKLWGDEGMLVADDACELSMWLSGDSDNGFVVGWTSGFHTYHPDDSHMQKLDAEGNVLWKEGGIRIRP
jgi:hypothetical protein